MRRQYWSQVDICLVRVGEYCEYDDTCHLEHLRAMLIFLNGAHFAIARACAYAQSVQALNKFGPMGGRITRLSGSRLLIFNVCTTSIVYAAGDQIQQQFEGRHHRRETDFWRSGRMTTVGAPLGALNHYWYMLLDRIIPGVTGRAVARKVLADMIIFGPICLTTFFVGMGILEKKNSKEISLDMKRLFPTAYLLEWILWPAAQAVNFYLVPTQMRVLYVNGVLLTWTVILSYVKHRDINSH